MEFKYAFSRFFSRFASSLLGFGGVSIAIAVVLFILNPRAFHFSIFMFGFSIVCVLYAIILLTAAHFFELQHKRNLLLEDIKKELSKEALIKSMNN